MSDPFDPYYIWLGIPPQDQPPNHYRLLGIELFEENRQVIEAAANRQMSYLQELSSGEEHIDEAQKLLGEVSRARVCLLDMEKKAVYDEQLREQIAASKEEFTAEEFAGDPLTPAGGDLATEEPRAGEGKIPAFPGIAGGGPQTGKKSIVPPPDGLQASPAATARPRRKKQKLVPIIGLAIAAVVLFGGGLTFYLSSQAQQREKDRKEEIAKEQKAFDRKAKEEAVRIEAQRKAKEEADRKAEEEARQKKKEKDAGKKKEEAERKAKQEAERKAKEEADRKAKEEAERKVKEEAERKLKQKTATAKAEARTFLESKGFIQVNEEWWPEAPYAAAEEDAKSLKDSDLFIKDNKAFWSQVGDFLKERQQIEERINSVKNDKQITTPLKLLEQQLASPRPPPPRLEGIATDFLKKQELEKTAGDIWRLKQEAKLKKAKDVKSNPSAEMLEQFNPAQQKLLQKGTKAYREVTRKEFQDLLALGRQLGATQGADFGLGNDGNPGRGGKGWERFNFLGWHHPDCNANEITGVKKDPKPFMKEAIEASLARLQNTEEWQRASKKRSKANTLRKTIDKKYRLLKNNSKVTVALQVVGGTLPEIEENK